MAILFLRELFLCERKEESFINDLFFSVSDHILLCSSVLIGAKSKQMHALVLQQYCRLLYSPSSGAHIFLKSLLLQELIKLIVKYGKSPYFLWNRYLCVISSICIHICFINAVVNSNCILSDNKYSFYVETKSIVDWILK